VVRELGSERRKTVVYEQAVYKIGYMLENLGIPGYLFKQTFLKKFERI